MTFYNLARKVLFSMDPENAHDWALRAMKLAWRTGTSRYIGITPVANPVTVMGLQFANPIGLAAGFDKSAEYVDALAALGFGFIEVGTLTPRPQHGSQRPRIFRLADQDAIINRMGFNNKGVEYAARQLEKISYRGILGINLGKNAHTPLDKAADDYLFGFRTLWKYASYITLNISSPNTPGLRELQGKEYLGDLLKKMKAEQAIIHQREKKYIPLVVKVSPDMTDEQISEIAEVLLQEKVDGVIATNTTLSRDGALPSPHLNESGGLSGMPLCGRSTHVIHLLSLALKKQIPIIASGGVMDEETAKDKIIAGASLLQVYTGFIFNGPNVIAAAARAFDQPATL